jgi:hypothetical protein
MLSNIPMLLLKNTQATSYYQRCERLLSNAQARAMKL